MKNTKSAFIAIIGRPNVGKSSLINKILPHKIAAVSSKPQTTRTRIMGVLTEKENQLVFIDTPGFHKPKNVLGENMVKAINAGLTDVDAAILVVDAAPKFKLNEGELPPAEEELISVINKRKIPAILAINKIDLIKNKEDLLDIIITYTNRHNFDAVVPISALDGDGIKELIEEAKKFSHDSIHYFAEDDITDQPERVLVSEIIREKLLRLLDKEIPHGIAVDIEQFYERDNKNGEPVIEVGAVIYCERDSHKGIIIGKNGTMLKRVGTKARIDIEEFFGCKCSLKLWVKVKEGWRNNPASIHNFGLDIK